VRKVLSIGLALIAGVGFLPAVPSSAATTSSTLLAGTVLGTDGTAAAGARVDVAAWPNGASLEALPKGAAVPLLDLGQATTDTAGRYRLDNALSSIPAKYLEPGGTINFDVTATLANDMQQHLSTTGARAAAVATPGVAVPGVQPARITFNMKRQQVVQAVGKAASTTTPARALATATTSADHPSPLAGVPTPGCTTWAKSTFYPNRTEHFMNLYTYGSASIHLETGSTQSLGIGFSAGGAWSGDGNATLTTSSSSAADGAFGSSQQLSNLVNYVAYNRTCPVKGGTTRYEHLVRPSSLAYLLTSAVHIPDRSWASCYPYSSAMRGKQYSKQQGAGQEFAVGISLPFMYLNARAAYTQSLSATWTIPSAGEDLCASSSAGWVLSDLVGGRAHPAPGCLVGSTVVQADATKPDC